MDIRNSIFGSLTIGIVFFLFVGLIGLIGYSLGVIIYLDFKEKYLEENTSGN